MERKPYSEHLAKTIDSYLRRNGWNYLFDEQEGLFRMNMTLDGKINQISYVVNVNLMDYTVLAFSPVSADPDNPEQLSAAADFICRANYGMRSGCFEMDHEDGEIRFKVFVDCDGELTPSDEIIQNSLFVPASMYDFYSGGLLEVLYGGKDPRTAVMECEKGMADVSDNPMEMIEALAEHLGVSVDELMDMVEDMEEEIFGALGEDDDEEDNGTPIAEGEITFDA